MSREGYWIRRNQTEFQATSWDDLCHWAQEGRIKLSDEYKTPESSQWRLVERDPILCSFIPQRERLTLKRGKKTYKAPHYEMIQEWAKRGQVSPDDMIYSSYTQLWTPVSELENILSHIPKQVIEKLEEHKLRRQGLGAALLGPDPKTIEDNKERIEPQDNMAIDQVMAICAPIYDGARLFIVIKDLRPFDRIKGECLLKSLKLDCQGMSKKEAFTELYEGLSQHHTCYSSNPEYTNMIGGLALLNSLHSFLLTIKQGLVYIGQVDEERFVVGNQNRPKLTAEEASLMINLQTAIEELIQAVRAFKQQHLHE